MTSKRDAQLRHATYYLDVLRLADRIGGDDISLALEQLDQNWEQIKHGQAWAATYGSEDWEILTLCTDYPTSSNFLLALRQKPWERINWLDEALVATRQYYQLAQVKGIHLGRVETVGQLDELLQRASEIESQLLKGYYLDEIDEIALERQILLLGQYRDYLNRYLIISIRQNEAVILDQLAMAYSSTGQYLQARDTLEQTLIIYRELQDRHGEGQCLAGFGRVYWELGHYEEATSYYEQALAISREIGNRQMEGHCVAGLGLVYAHLKQYDQATSCLEHALSIHREVGDQLGESSCFINLGLVFFHLRHFEQAASYFERALKVALEIGDKRRISLCLDNLGSVYTEMGLYEKATDLLERAFVIAQEFGDKGGQGICLSDIGLVYAHLSQYEKAIEYYQQARTIFEAIRVPHLVALVEARIAEAWAKSVETSQ